MSQAACCFIPCDKSAEWVINWGPTVDDYTEACTAHVGELFDDSSRFTVWPIVAAGQFCGCFCHSQEHPLPHVDEPCCAAAARSGGTT